MQNTDEQIRKMLELKETIIEKMSKYQDEIDFLQKNLDVLDVVLKGSSFTKASALAKNITKEEPDILDTHEDPLEVKKQIIDSKDGGVIANAFVTPDQVSIILEDGIGLTPEIPPLKTFFIERIIGEMKKSDDVAVKDGKINKESVIDCVINKNGSAIREIIIKNYRQKERVDEIINTATWSLARMVENSSK
ncbi:MAG: hypothetical protein VX539_01105 [Thermoproteota archaeon]|nr:hypothetical protein [Thermoproteota archaeon]